VTEADLEQLPRPVQRYLRFMGVLGRPRDWSLRAHLTGRFRLTADRSWTPCEAWQYSSGGEPARLFRMRLNVMGMPMTGWDTYLRGGGGCGAPSSVLSPSCTAAGRGSTRASW
jgi:hypothetical protein